ncbi:MAG: hypothetical protein IJ551_09645 [Prevotella sp.]|nr:hypothetical protein [Prevotella sp.]
MELLITFIWFTGVIVCIVLSYKKAPKEITLLDAFGVLVVSTFSWVTALFIVMIIYGDKVIYRKKKK